MALETTKLRQNHLFDMLFYTPNEKYDTFLSISLTLVSPEISTDFLHIRRIVFRQIQAVGFNNPEQPGSNLLHTIRTVNVYGADFRDLKIPRNRCTGNA